jgi:hypothetical protein
MRPSLISSFPSAERWIASIGTRCPGIGTIASILFTIFGIPAFSFTIVLVAS